MTHSQQLQNAQRELQRRRGQAGIPYRPPAPDTNGRSQPWYKELAPKCQPQETPAAPTASKSAPTAPIWHHGDIATAALSSGQSCHYQLWLALRWLDDAGSGCVALSAAQEALTADSAADTYLYKPARLRQVVAEGNGRFWTNDGERLFLRSEARVAHALGVQRLSGRHVQIAPGAIFCRIQKFRAHAFAAWLANRKNPISQSTIEQMTGIPPRTQRRYCELAGVDTTANIALGPRHNQQTHQDCAWNHPGTFAFTDYKGLQGPAMRRYVAWRLPTSYADPNRSGGRRRQKRTNGALTTLWLTRNTGNRQNAPQKLFFANGRQAAQAAGRQEPGDVDLYWPGKRTRQASARIWHCMSV